MYQVLLRRRAVKDLANLAKEYRQLVAQHIDGLSQNPRPPDSKKLRGDGGYSGLGFIAYSTTSTTARGWSPSTA